MKKINTSLRAQSRRAGALERFAIDATRDKTDAAYRARKDQELAALKSRLGI